MKNKLLATGDFDIKFLPPGTCKKFIEIRDMLTPYARFLYMVPLIKQMQKDNIFSIEKKNYLYQKEKEKINFTFFDDNFTKNTELAQSWFQELIDKELIEISLCCHVIESNNKAH